jgi:hypothetical protein
MSVLLFVLAFETDEGDYSGFDIHAMNLNHEFF